MGWFEILKEEPEWKKRLRRIEEANKKTSQGGMDTPSKQRRKAQSSGRGESTTGKTVTCDMCGKLMHVRSAREGSTDTGLKYCKQCAKARGV
jgi:hypothetical protein